MKRTSRTRVCLAGFPSPNEETALFPWFCVNQRVVAETEGKEEKKKIKRNRRGRG
jgi:hypothetical protein